MKTQLARDVLVRYKLASPKDMFHVVGVKFEDLVLDLPERSRRVARVKKSFRKAFEVQMLQVDEAVTLTLTFPPSQIPSSKVEELCRELSAFLLRENWVEYAFLDVDAPKKSIHLRIAC